MFFGNKVPGPAIPEKRGSSGSIVDRMKSEHQRTTMLLVRLMLGVIVIVGAMQYLVSMTPKTKTHETKKTTVETEEDQVKKTDAELMFQQMVAEKEKEREFISYTNDHYRPEKLLTQKQVYGRVSQLLLEEDSPYENSTFSPENVAGIHYLYTYLRSIIDNNQIEARTDPIPYLELTASGYNDQHRGRLLRISGLVKAVIFTRYKWNSDVIKRIPWIQADCDSEDGTFKREEFKSGVHTTQILLVSSDEQNHPPFAVMVAADPSNIKVDDHISVPAVFARNWTYEGMGTQRWHGLPLVLALEAKPMAKVAMQDHIPDLRVMGTVLGVLAIVVFAVVLTMATRRERTVRAERRVIAARNRKMFEAIKSQNGENSSESPLDTSM